jgi:hypothetical protein
VGFIILFVCSGDSTLLLWREGYILIVLHYLSLKVVVPCIHFVGRVSVEYIVVLSLIVLVSLPILWGWFCNDFVT